MACIKCGGKGEYMDKELGIMVKCDCTNPVNGSELLDKAEDVSIERNKEYLRKLREQTASGANAEQASIGIGSTSGLTYGDSQSAYVFGAVPEHRKDDNFSPEYAMNVFREDFKKTGMAIIGVNKYLSTLNSIYLDIQQGKRVEHSYFISAHNGFGKTTFANTCIKELHKQGKKVAPYISLMELYNLMTAEQLLIRLNKAYILEAYKRNDTDDGMQMSRNDWRMVQNTNLVFQEYSLEDFISRYKQFEFSYIDFLECEILFISISPSFIHGYEVPLLKYLLQERGRKGKSTILMGDQSLSSYIKEADMANMWRDMIADNNNPYESKAMDRMLYVACYRETKKGVEIAKGKAKRTDGNGKDEKKENG